MNKDETVPPFFALAWGSWTRSEMSERPEKQKRMKDLKRYDQRIKDLK